MLVDRYTAHGVFFHRDCFRCATCATLLHVGTSVFQKKQHKGQYRVRINASVRVGWWVDVEAVASYRGALLMVSFFSIVTHDS